MTTDTQRVDLISAEANEGTELRDPAKGDEIRTCTGVLHTDFVRPVECFRDKGTLTPDTIHTF